MIDLILGLIVALCFLLGCNMIRVWYDVPRRKRTLNTKKENKKPAFTRVEPIDKKDPEILE